jgi:hypothetical protein
MLGLIVAVGAMAAAPSAGDFAAFELGERVWAPDATDLRPLGFDASFEGGFAFDVLLGGSPVGFVLVADGALDVAPPSEAQRVRLANQRVVLLGEPVAAVRPMVDGAAWTLDVDLVVALGRGALDLLPDDAALGGRVIDGTETVVVTDLSGAPRARAQAASALRDRVASLVDQGLDPRVVLAAEGAVPGVSGQAVLLAHTTTGLQGLLGGPPLPADAEWLVAWRDPAGATPSSERVELRARSDGDGIVARVLADTPSGGAPAAWSVVSRKVDARFELVSRDVQMRAVASLDLRAEVDGVDRIVVDVPRVVQYTSTPAMPPSASRFSVDAVLVGAPGDAADGVGRALPWRFVDAASVDPAADTLRLQVDLAGPVARGAVIRVWVAFSDHALFAHFAWVERAGRVELHDIGQAARPIAVLPTVVHAAPPSAPATIDASVRPIARLSTVTSGAPGVAPSIEGWQTTRTADPSASPAVAVGRWHWHEEPAARGLPAVAVATFGGWPRPQRSLATHTRQVLSFFEPLLPPPPDDRVQVVQAAGIEGLLVHDPARAGVVTLPTGALFGVSFAEVRLRNGLPHLEWVFLAEDFAAQHWVGWLEGGPEAFAIASGVARTYGVMLAETLFGDDVAPWHRAPADCVASVPRGSTPVDGFGYNPGGPLVSLCFATGAIGGALRETVGDRAWLAAMDGVVSGRVGGGFDVDRIGRALSEAAGRDVRPVVDFWLSTAIAPKVVASWSADGDVVRVDARSDVPFGTFELPFEVRGPAGSARGRVVVVDGVGRAEQPFPGAVDALVLDPAGRLMLASAEVTRDPR